jgi:hypothetical protein
MAFPDGNIWYTEPGEGKVVRFVVPCQAEVPTISPSACPRLCDITWPVSSGAVAKW